MNNKNFLNEFSAQIQSICDKHSFNHNDIPLGMLNYMVMTNDLSILEDYIVTVIAIPKNSSSSLKGYLNQNMSKNKYYVLIKEFNSSKQFTLQYKILAVSKSANMLKDMALKHCKDILKYGDPWFTTNYQNDTIVSWQSGRKYYSGYSKDPSTNICYTVLEKPVKEF